nr:hypothetical protein [uncultured Acidovorax sp.]
MKSLSCAWGSKAFASPSSRLPWATSGKAVMRSALATASVSPSPEAQPHHTACRGATVTKAKAKAHFLVPNFLDVLVLNAAPIWRHSTPPHNKKKQGSLRT